MHFDAIIWIILEAFSNASAAEPSPSSERRRPSIEYTRQVTKGTG